MMSRILIVVVAVLVFFWLLRRALGSRGQKRGPPPAPDAAKEAKAVADLVSCAQCGVHLPKNEALAGDAAGVPGPGRFYCSDAHRRLGPR